MNKIKRLFILALALLMVLPIAVSASVPYATYTYSGQGLILASPDAYVPDVVVDSQYMGLPKGLGNDVRDMFVAPDGRIYIADASNNRIVVLNKYYKMENEILKLGDQLIPLSTSYTQSGKAGEGATDKGGRPEKDDSEKTEQTVETNDARGEAKNETDPV